MRLSALEIDQVYAMAIQELGPEALRAVADACDEERKTTDIPECICVDVLTAMLVLP